MNNRMYLVTLFSLALACAREQSPTPLPVPVDSSGPLEIEWGARLLQPWEIERQSECGQTDEFAFAGWSRNTGEFVYCLLNNWSDSCARRCTFHRAGIAHQHVSYGDEEVDGEKICDQPRAAYEQRLATDDVHIEENWAYGADVVLVVAEELKKTDSEGLARKVIKIGARLRSEGASVAWVDSIDECEGQHDFCEPGRRMEFHLDAIVASPDGQTIAVLAYAFPWAEEEEDAASHPLRFLDARTLADAAHAADAGQPTSSSASR